MYANEDKSIWTESGLAWRRSESVKEPSFLKDEKWNQPDYPVVGVSWFEACAFCNWLTRNRNDGYVYQLPDEKQWERAARWTDGRVYPWGNKFDKERCNTKESGIGRTTRVTRYPNGISHDGCYDMVGNVWEWTRSPFEKGGPLKLLRGGSWDDDPFLARCTGRLRVIPHFRSYDVGFRCARTK
jgi:formylglycine-generating enzyme required for sulfatase activity